MANDENSKSYDQAREMTEKALDAYVEGDAERAGKLVEEAKSVDERAVKDVGDELEEDASSEHDPAKLNDQMASKDDKPS